MHKKTPCKTKKILQGVFLCSDIYVRPQGRSSYGDDFLCRDYLPPVLGFLSLLRLRVLFPLCPKLSEPVAHTLSFGRSVLFFSGFLSVLNCLLPFCEVLVILCHNSLCFAVSSHKCLYIRITVVRQNIGEFTQFFIKLGFGLLYLFFQSLAFLAFEDTRCFSNLLSNGAAPKDVQELLGHSDVSTTMNIYAHSKREAKRTSARLLDKVVGEA